MKKVLFYAAVATFAVALAACKKKDDGSSETDGTIGGVTWATANVDDFQTFAVRPDMYTKFYQWNRATAWDTTNLVRWNTLADNSTTWTVNPCPTGWRLPTHDEQVALHNAGSTWATAGARGNAVAGRFYGPGHATCSLPDNMGNCVFLPAVGYRSYSGGALNGQGSYGYYWSSTEVSSSNGHGMDFISTYSYPNNSSNKAYGYSVRCVQ